MPLALWEIEKSPCSGLPVPGTFGNSRLRFHVWHPIPTFGSKPIVVPGVCGFPQRNGVLESLSTRVLRSTQQQFNELQVCSPQDGKKSQANQRVLGVSSAEKPGTWPEGEILWEEGPTVPGRRMDFADRGDPGSVEEAAEVLGSQAGSIRGTDESRGIVATIASYFGLSPRVQGLILLNLMTVLMATNWVVVKEAEETLDPFVFSALRFSVAAAAFFPFLKGAIQNRKVFRAGLEVGVWSSLGYILQAVGLMTTDASRASFLSTFTVILVPILVGATGRGVSKTTWGAAGLALVGTGLLESGGSAASIGDAYNLLSAACFAIQILRTEHFSRCLPRSTNLSLLSASLITTAVMGGLLTAVTHPREVASTLHSLLIPTEWLSSFRFPYVKELLYTGLLSTDLVLLIEMVALHDVSSTDAAIIYTMEPVLGSLLAYFVLGERWGPMGWLGAGLIISSSLFTQLSGEKEDCSGRAAKNSGNSSH